MHALPSYSVELPHLTNESKMSVSTPALAVYIFRHNSVQVLAVIMLWLFVLITVSILIR